MSADVPKPPFVLQHEGHDKPVTKLTYDDVAQHNTAEDCWVIINNKAYDLTDFAEEHPGGPAVVTESAGKDATAEFLDAHPEDIMKLTLGRKGLEQCFRGDVIPSTIPQTSAAAAGHKAAAAATAPPPAESLGAHTVNEDGIPLDEHGAPPLEMILNLHDFEAVAQRVMHSRGRKQAWDYYSSGADDELTYNENVNAFQRVWLQPRILVDVANVDTSTALLGQRVGLPVYLSAVAMCGMGHPDGELAWAHAAHAKQTVFMAPILSSKPFDEIVAVGEKNGQPLFFQIYVNPDRSIVQEQLAACEKAGIKALCITVDSAVPGKRERDLRNKLAMQAGRGAFSQQAAAAKGTRARKPGSFANRDPGLCWKDIEWFKQHTSIPLVIKGVQCAADAVQAARAGAKAIILSNHGGRNLDTSRSGLEVLPDVVAALRAAGLRGSIEVWIDGGIRRGTDILKAIAMGADAVGVGKPAVYAMSAYGQRGIEKMLETLRTELVTAMRLVGAATLADIVPGMVNCDDLKRHTVVAPLPPSPFALRAPPKNVRSPPPVNAPQNAAEVRAAIERLTAKLHALEGGAGGAGAGAGGRVEGVHGSGAVPGGRVPAVLADLVSVVRAVVVAVLKTVFATSASGMLHRSAIFLLVFLVVHMAGNLTVFAGPAVFNEYGHKLASNPLTKFIEWYLLLASVVHAAVGAYFSWNKRGVLRKKPFARTSVLLSTSVLVVVFVVAHLRTFRFGADIGRDAAGRRDLYAAQLALFADEKQVGFYLVSLAALAVHLWFGWSKTVLKFDIPKSARARFVAVGHGLIWPLFIGFAVCPMYCYLLARGTGVGGIAGAAGPSGGEGEL
eukprot:g3856.t1